MNIGFNLGTLGMFSFFLALAGCQPTEELPITGLVKGSVKFNGKPVAAGVISFDNKKDGIGATAVIADGKFTFDGAVSAGHYQVTVQPPQPEPLPLGAPPKPPQQFNDIPTRYRSTSTSDLVAEVHEGDNDLEFALKP